MAFIDFQAIKRLASLEMVANWLGLDVKHGRCQCPVNEGDKRELVLTYDKGVWYCFGCKKKYPHKRNGGDQIELVAHCLDVDVKTAAGHISKKFHGYTPARKGLPDGGLDYLEYQHPRVQALGLSPIRAEELGIGYAPKGTRAKHVLFPLRDESGKLLGYIPYAEDGSIHLPKSLLE